MGFIRNEQEVIYVDEQGGRLAEVTFPAVGEDTVEIDHTYVDPSLRGTGMAGKLMMEAAKTIQEQGKRAVLTCSYAVQWFERHPEYAGLIKEAEK